MNDTIKLGDVTIDIPFTVKCAKYRNGAVGWYIADRNGLDILETHEDDDEMLVRYAVAALNDYRPWRYPSKGEMPEKDRTYEVSFVGSDGNARTRRDYWSGLAWCEYPNVYAFRDLSEPAPILIEQSGENDPVMHGADVKWKRTGTGIYEGEESK